MPTFLPFGGGDGAETIYALRNNSTLSNKVLSEIEKEGQNGRKYYQQRLPSNPIKDYYFIHRNTPNTEALIVEYGFLDSKGDDVNQLKNNYEKYAEAVVRAIADYKGIKYVAPVDSGYYTVVKGDSLWSVATKFGLTIDELKSLNNLTSNVLSVGQTLKVASSEEEKLPEDFLIYVVQKGDSLYTIAEEFDTTVTTLKEVNNLTSNLLQINQQLLIPKSKEIEIEVEQGQTKYKVKSGDTLYSIANKYNVSVNSLKEINKLNSNNLQINQELIIPGNTTIVEEVEESSNGINYVVQSGDNLYSIANKYGVSVNDIKNANNLTSNLLQIGDVLLIPGTSNYANYTVKSGDTLYSIANKYGTNVQNLKTINNLVTNNLSVGQELLIPSN